MLSRMTRFVTRSALPRLFGTVPRSGSIQEEGLGRPPIYPNKFYVDERGEDEAPFGVEPKDMSSSDIDPTKPRIGVVGAGNFGRAALEILLQSNSASQIIVSGRTSEKMKVLEEETGVKSMPTSELAKKSDVLIFFVKPNDMEAALKAAMALKENALVMSAVAAYPLAAIRKALNRKDVGFVRFMSSLSLDAIFFCAPPEISDAHKKMAEDMFPGKKFYWLSDEHQLEKTVAYIGCLPGVIYFMLGTLAEKAEQDGLPKEIISEGILRTVQGTGSLPLKSGESIDFRKEERKVATPQGFTAGINRQLDLQDVQRSFAGTIRQAAQKCCDASDQNLPKEGVKNVLPTGPLEEKTETSAPMQPLRKFLETTPEKTDIPEVKKRVFGSEKLKASEFPKESFSLESERVAPQSSFFSNKSLVPSDEVTSSTNSVGKAP